MAAIGKDKLCKEIITATLTAGETRAIVHRIGIKPHKFKIKNEAGIGPLEITAWDEDTVTVYNPGVDLVKFKMFLERFHSAEADVGMTDQTTVPETKTDGPDMFDDRFFLEISCCSAIITYEDPWIRYVNGTTGNDTTGDGLTAGTAWATVGKALREKPFIHGAAIIVVAAGTYAEAVTIKDGIGSLAIIGEWDEVYANTLYIGATYAQVGGATAEGYTQIDVDYSGEAGFVCNDTLLDMYLEFDDDSGPPAVRYRCKILEYTALGGQQVRLILGGFTPTNVAAAPNDLKFVKEATIIESDATKGITVEIEGSYTQTKQGDYTPSQQSGVFLHALKISNTKAAGTAYALAIRTNADVQLGNISLSVVKNRGVSIMNTGTLSGILVYASSFGTLMPYIESRINYSSPSASVRSTHGTMLMSGKSKQSFCIFDWTDNPLYLSGIQFDGYYQIYKKGSYISLSNDLISFHVSACSTLGTYIKAYRGLKIEFYGKVGFRGNPSSSHGRICFFGMTQVYFRGGIDCGDVTGHAAAVPIISLLDQTNFACGGAIDIGSAGFECPAPSELILVDNQSKMRVDGKLTVHQDKDSDVASIIIDDNSEFLSMNVGADSIELNATQPRTPGGGLIEVTGQSKMHCLGAVSINHLLHAAAGSGLAVIESECYFEAAYTSSTLLTGFDLYAYEARLKIEGNVTQNQNGASLHAEGENTRVRIYGNIAVTTTKTPAPIHMVVGGAKANFYGEIEVNTLDRGAFPLYMYADGGTVEWDHFVTDGDATHNRNLNAAGYGISVKRGANLTCNTAQAIGPDGGAGPGFANEIDLGVVGPAVSRNYPAMAGNSVNDITNGVESTASLSVVHRR